MIPGLELRQMLKKLSKIKCRVGKFRVFFQGPSICQVRSGLIPMYLNSKHTQGKFLVSRNFQLPHGFLVFLQLELLQERNLAFFGP